MISIGEQKTEGERQIYDLNQQEKDTIKIKVAETMKQFPSIDLGYIFGSFLLGSFHDLDCAILIDPALPIDQAGKYRRRVEGAIEKAIGYLCPVDCKLLNDAPISFSFEVIKTGIRVYERNAIIRIRYEASQISLWQDYQETLIWFNQRYIEAI
jgi:hypothetical protein